MPQPSALEPYKPRNKVDIVVFPTFLDLKPCIDAGLNVGAQCAHPEDAGAHTGDISMKMIADVGCQYVLCGHSERRRNHKESNEFVAAQVISALKHGLHPILCIGETWEERKAGKSKEVVKEQLQIVISAFSHLRIVQFTVAYEPVWAISGGDSNKPAATAADAQEMHAFIRSFLSDISAFSHLRILYGGSMKPENAEELLAQPDIDGGLVGNASLDPEKFREIVGIAAKITRT